SGRTIESMMLDQTRIHEIFSRVRRYSSADELELSVSAVRHALTRFANNTIHQNVAEENTVVSVRVQMDGRTARATTNKLDDESLQRVVAAAESLTRVQPADPDLLPMCTPAETAAAEQRATPNAPRRGTHLPPDYEPPSRWFDATAAIGPA